MENWIDSKHGKEGKSESLVIARIWRVRVKKRTGAVGESGLGHRLGSGVTH